MAKNIMGKSRAETITAGWRAVRSTERRASAATLVRIEEPILGLLCLLGRTLERPPCLLQEHVVERRLVEPKVRDLEVLRVQGAHDVGEATPVEADGDGPWLGGDLLPEATENPHYGCALSWLRGRRLDAGAPDLGLQRLRGVLGDDAPLVYDPDPVGQHVGLLQVLRREKDRHPVLAREAAHLRPHRVAA